MWRMQRLDAFYTAMAYSSFILNAVNFYLTAFKSKHDFHVRVLFIYVQMAGFVFDMYVTILMRPVLLFPHVGGFGRGLLTEYFDVPFHIQFALFVFLFGMLLTAILCSYMQKHRAVASVDGDHELGAGQQRFTWAALHVFPLALLVCLCNVPLAVNIQLSEGHVDLRQLGPRVEVAATEPNVWATSTFFAFVLMMLVLGVLGLVFPLHTLNLLRQLRPFTSGTAKTADAHVAANARLLAHVLIPMTTLYVPGMFGFLVCVLEAHQFTEACQVALCISCTHSTLQAIATISMTSRYRKFIIRGFKRLLKAAPIRRRRAHEQEKFFDSVRFDDNIEPKKTKRQNRARIVEAETQF